MDWYQARLFFVVLHGMRIIDVGCTFTLGDGYLAHTMLVDYGHFSEPSTRHHERRRSRCTFSMSIPRTFEWSVL